MSSSAQRPLDPSVAAASGPAHRAWLLAPVSLLLLWGLAAWRDRPPVPVPASAPAGEFSEERALAVCAHLVDGIGARVLDTEGAEAAARYLERTLRQLPGVEVSVDDSEQRGPQVFDAAPAIYNVRNILARLPGATSTALLVSTHFDTKPDTAGAADAAAPTGAMVELVRALAAGPRLRQTVVFNFNGGEELGLLGALTFTRHPWMKDVRAAINLDAGGSGGKSILFQTTPGRGRLVSSYARSAPYPYATSVAADLFQTRIIPSDTDFRIYRDVARLPGLDFVLYQDGYAYHTDRDELARLQPGSVQHMGANTLALVRELAGDSPREGDAPFEVYHDVLGWLMVVYSGGTARVLAGVTALLVALAAASALRHTRRAVGSALLLLPLGAGAALAVPFALSWIPSSLHPHGWFSSPWLAVLTFTSLSAAGLLGAHALWARAARAAGPVDRALAASLVTLLPCTAALLWLSWRDSGASYLFLWSSLPAALGLLVASRCAAAGRPAAVCSGALLLGAAPGALISLETGLRFFRLLVPVSGRIPLKIPFDPVVALYIGAVVALATPQLTALLHLGAPLKRAAAAAAALGLLGLGGLLLRPPYSVETPKRLVVEQYESPSLPPRATFRSLDPLPVELALAALPQKVRSKSPQWQDERYAVAVPASNAPQAELTLVDSRVDPATGNRHLTLRAFARAPARLYLEIPSASLVSWSLSDALPQVGEAEPYRVDLLTPQRAPELRLTLRRAEPVSIKVTEKIFARSAGLDPVLSQLPAWVTALVIVHRERTVAL